MCKKLIKNSQPFGKNCQKTAGEIFLDSHCTLVSIYLTFLNFDGISSVRTWQRMTDFAQLLVQYGSISCEYMYKHMCGAKLPFLTRHFLDSLKHGYHNDACSQLKPTTTDVLPAKKAIIEMVRCQCKTDFFWQRCSCRAKNLTCTGVRYFLWEWWRFKHWKTGPW